MRDRLARATGGRKPRIWPMISAGKASRPEIISSSFLMASSAAVTLTVASASSIVDEEGDMEVLSELKSPIISSMILWMSHACCRHSHASESPP